MYPATMASADFSLRPCGRRPFRREASSPQVRTRSFTAQPPDLRDRSLTTKSFAAVCLLALIGRASLSGFCPSARGFALRFLSTLGRPCAVALRFARCGQLTGGLSPPRSRPCWAHTPSASKCSHPPLTRSMPYAPSLKISHWPTSMRAKSAFWKLVARCWRPGWASWPALRGRGRRRAPSAASTR